MTFDVVVIGAGAAGLTAAIQLVEGGYKVALVEAREHPGGRLYTISTKEGPVELGAEFIHGLPPQLLHLLEEAALATIEVKGEDRCHHYANGEGLLKKCDEQEDAFAVLSKLGEEPPDPDLSFIEFAVRQRFSKSAVSKATNFVEGFNAADASKISARSLAMQRKAEDRISGDRSFRLTEGYSRLAEYLLKRFVDKGGEAFFSHAVRSVRWQPGSVVIEADGKEIKAKAGIVTLPLGVLQARSVAFEPLPTEVLKAADSLAMGAAIRIVFEFREAFWRRSPGIKKLGFLFAPESLPPTWWTTMPRESSLLTGWAGGPKARGLDLSQLESSGLATLASIFKRPLGDLRADLVQCHFHDWQRDAFSLGAYSYIPKGQIKAPRQMTNPAEGTLFFAGEHTDLTGHTGTVHGAIGSGYRAAAQTIAALQAMI